MASKVKKQGLAEGHTVLGSPLTASLSRARTSVASTKTRRNSSSTIERTDRLANIEDGLVPFKYGTGSKSSSITVRDAIILCQKAYYNFALFRNTIDLMAEFSTSNIYFRGGSVKSRKFFEALYKKTLASFQDKFFREHYRSGNTWIYRLDAFITPEDMSKLTQTFGAEAEPLPSKPLSLPAKYIILNPADIQVGGSVSFSTGQYYKVLSDYELEVLRNPKTEEDNEVLSGFEPEIRKAILDGKSKEVLIPLRSDKVSCVFYKKQDYEPFAVPMGFPVLDDINWKAEMKKMDMAIARTAQQAILLITMGTDPEKGGVNQKNLEAMQTLFENESVGRVLIADYTTKAQFVLPPIAEILDPKKYEIVDKDIQIGLNNILIGSEKFANQSIKVQVFIERLKQAREAFINEFLLPEIKRIAKDMGFKNYPTPHFEDIDLKDDLEFSRIYTRLIEIGVLTPEEGVEAINTGRLPTAEESVESQRKFKGYKDEGFYQPIVGGPKDQMELAEKTGEIQEGLQQQKLSQETGRPPGTKRKQSTKKVSPIGASESYSLVKVKDNLLKAQELEMAIERALKRHFKLGSLAEEQQKLVPELALIIMANEDPKEWNSKIAQYIKNPIDTNAAAVEEIHEIAYQHQLDSYLATILRASKV